MTPHRHRRAVRRAVAAATGLALVLAACSDAEPGAEPAVPTTALPSPDPEPSDGPTDDPSDATGDPGAEPEPTTAPPPLPARWRPTENEVAPNAKTLASDVVHDLLNHDLGTTPADAAARVVPDDPERAAALAEAIADVVDPRRVSRARVVYPQLGGFAPDATSVMVVVEQSTSDADGGDRRVEVRTIDVRLRLVDEVWQLDFVDDDGGPPVPRPDDLPELAAAVVGDPRIDLPDSALWDIYEGGIDDRVLRLMLVMADVAPYSAVTLTRGHPDNVFNTDRLSDHTVGRAVDIWAVDGVPIVEDRQACSGTALMVTALYGDPDLKQLGSPWNLDTIRAISFTDFVHQDHLHVAAGVPTTVLPPSATPAPAPSPTPSVTATPDDPVAEGAPGDGSTPTPSPTPSPSPSPTWFDPNPACPDLPAVDLADEGA